MIKAIQARSRLSRLGQGYPGSVKAIQARSKLSRLSRLGQRLGQSYPGSVKAIQARSKLSRLGQSYSGSVKAIQARSKLSRLGQGSVIQARSRAKASGSVKAIQARLRLFRWAEAASSRPVSRAPVCNRASNTSCRRPDHPSSTATWNRPDVPTRRSSDNCTTATLPWALNRAVRHWETVYYTIRPHQSLDGRTLAKYLASCHPQLALPFHMYRTSASRFRSRRIPL